MTIPKNAQINLLIRIVVGVVFIITGIGKIALPDVFARDIGHYDMLPNVFINLTAIILPWIELLSGILLIFGIRIKANIIISGAMLLVFNIAVATAWARGLNIDCGCFGDIAQQNVGIEKLAENFAMLAGLTFMLIFPSDDKFSFERTVEANE